MVVLWTAVWSLLGIFILLVTLTLLPVSFSGQAGLDETAGFEAVLTWVGGLISFQATAAGGLPLEMYLHLGKWTRRLQPDGLSWVKAAGPYLDKAVLKEVFRYLFRLERSLGLRLSFEGEIGLGDPEFTGYLAGLLPALNTGQWECNLHPNFTETVLHFQGTVQGRLMPARVLWLTGCLLLSPPVRSIWWSQLKQPKNKVKAGDAVVND